MSSLKKDFAKVAGSNVLLILASTLNNFVLPIVLSITDYANYKTYILYVGFAGFFHLGYVDGINIKYGGKDLSELEGKTFWNEHHFFILTQLVISAVLLIAAFISKSLVLGLFAISIVPINMQSFFLFFLQAVGQFSIYAKSFIVVPLLMSVATCLVFVTHFPCGYLFFCVVYVFCYIISWALLEWRTIRVLGFSKRIDLFANKINHISIIQSGFFIMMGTIVFGFFTSIGQWLIKWEMDDNAFALFSMAASLLGFVLVFVNAVNKVFYPYLCKNKDNNESHQLLIDVLIFLATMSLPFYYVLEIVIELILPNYSAAISIIKLLLLTLPAIVIIQSFYINLYKANRLEKLYMKDGLLYTLLAVVINAFALYLFNDIKAIATSSVICSYIWLFFPNKHIYVLNNRFKFLVYFVLIFAIYFLSDFLCSNLFISFVIAFFGILAVNLVFYRRTIVTKVLNI